MTKEEFNNLKRMLASSNVDDINLGGVLLAKKLGLTNRASKNSISLRQISLLLQTYYDNREVGFSPKKNECDFAHLFMGDLVQYLNQQQ